MQLETYNLGYNKKYFELFDKRKYLLNMELKIVQGFDNIEILI